MSRLCYFLIPLALFTSSCGEDNRNRIAVEEMIQEEVANRVATYRENRTNRCYQDAVKEAGTLADSILLIQARLKRDTLSKPPRPNKPGRPPAKILRDSLLEIAPFLSEDSILSLLRVDSLRRDSLREDSLKVKAEDIDQ
ncbi:MAG: hypothetical protein KI786_16685 [Mameliella sp.]|nr:hypothetical protein [Phaeodactylibacter sp.]